MFRLVVRIPELAQEQRAQYENVPETRGTKRKVVSYREVSSDEEAHNGFYKQPQSEARHDDAYDPEFKKSKKRARMTNKSVAPAENTHAPRAARATKKLDGSIMMQIKTKNEKEYFQTRFWGMCFEIREMIVVGCVTGRRKNSSFIEALSMSRDMVKHRDAILKAIQHTEFVISGPAHRQQLLSCHPRTRELVKYIRIVCTQVSNSDRIRRPPPVIAHLIAQRATALTRLAAGESGLYVPGVSDHYRHVHGPIIPNTHHIRFWRFWDSVAAFRSLTEVILDFSSQITWTQRNRSGPGMGALDYLDNVLSFLIAAEGKDVRVDRFLPANPNTVARRWNEHVQLEKLTLILTPLELSRPFRAKWYERLIATQTGVRDIRDKMHEYSMVPSYIYIKHLFEENEFCDHDRNQKGVQVPPLTDITIDRQKGVVVYKRPGYRG